MAGREPLANLGQGGQRSGFAGLDQLRAASEGVPIHSADIGGDHQVRFAAPVVFGTALQNLETAVDDLKGIAGLHFWSGARQVDRNHVGSSELPRQGRRDFHTHRTIHEELPAVADRVK